MRNLRTEVEMEGFLATPPTQTVPLSRSLFHARQTARGHGRRNLAKGGCEDQFMAQAKASVEAKMFCDMQGERRQLEMVNW